MRKKFINAAVVLMLSTFSLQASATEYKCYVTASDTLHYIVIVDFDSPGMAALAARHVWITNPATGKVGVQDVHECIILDKPFHAKAARELEKVTPLESINNPRN
jgi:hypothetical protein